MFGAAGPIGGYVSAAPQTQGVTINKVVNGYIVSGGESVIGNIFSHGPGVYAEIDFESACSRVKKILDETDVKREENEKKLEVEREKWQKQAAEGAQITADPVGFALLAAAKALDLDVEDLKKTLRLQIQKGAKSNEGGE